jgi:hypothetical protein
MKVSVTELPFNSLLGIQIATDSAHLLELPAGGQYLNHLGTVHASAQLALAEASSGEFLLRHFGSAQGSFQSYVDSKQSFASPLTAQSRRP